MQNTPPPPAAASTSSDKQQQHPVEFLSPQERAILTTRLNKYTVRLFYLYIVVVDLIASFHEIHNNNNNLCKLRSVPHEQ